MKSIQAFKKFFKGSEVKTSPVRIYVEESTECRRQFTVFNEFFTVYSMEGLYRYVNKIVWEKFGYHFLKTNSYYLEYRGKMLNRTLALQNYNFQHGYNTLDIKFFVIVGGSDSIQLPTYNHIKETEIRLLAELSGLKVQAGTSQEYSTGQNLRTFLYYVQKGMAPLLKSYDGYITEETFARMIENVSVILTFSRKCDQLSDYIALSQMSYRMMTGDCLSVAIDKRIKELFEPVVQSDVRDILGFLRKCMDTTETIGDHPWGKRIVSLYSYMLTHGCLKWAGIELNDEQYSRLEQKAFLACYSSKKTFALCVLETVLFTCERLHEWYETGDVSRFVHTTSEYKKWLDEATRILNLAPFVGNLSAHGTNYFSYLSDLRDAIERGEAYEKYVRSVSGTDLKLISAKLNSLKLLNNTEITRKAAQQERTQPMGVLVYGSSSVAKSAFTKILYNYYAALFQLDNDDSYRYVRNPMDEYWSNFDSGKWCIQLDDIAFLNPAKTTQVDSTLQDLLNVVNNVPYVPPQASLDDKGKTPVMARLVIATTNAKHLNAHEYFHCPIAVQRRLPLVVSVKPKEAFLHENRKFIDPSKIICEDGKYPDLWEIQVDKIVPQDFNGQDRAKFETVQNFSNINEFLKFYGKACLEHEANQKKAMVKDKDMKNITICPLCLSPLPHTSACVDVQSGTLNVVRNYIQEKIVEFWCSVLFCHYLISWMAYFRVTRFLGVTLLNYSRDSALVARFCGIFHEVSTNRYKKTFFISCILGVVVSCLCLYMSHKSSDKKEEKVTKDKKKESVAENRKEEEFEIDEDTYYKTPLSPLDVQGNSFGTTSKDLLKEDTQNVWYSSHVELTSFDIPKESQSLKGCSDVTIRDIFQRNCVLLHIRGEGGSSTRIMRGTFLRGHQLLTNAHAFVPGFDTYTVKIIQSNDSAAINSNIKIRVDRCDIAFGTSDLCVFEVDSLPPFKDIMKFWVEGQIPVSRSVELFRNIDGSCEINPLLNLNLMKGFKVESLEKELDIYFGHSTRETEDGLCGAICVATTPRGPTICGIHLLGRRHNVGVLSVIKSEIEELLARSCLLQYPVVQGGGVPILKCADKTHELGPLHQKSVFRFLEKGSLNIYGSFSGFRPKPRSSVCHSPLHDEVLAKYDEEEKYGRPNMGGWQPWRNNVIDMVVPEAKHKKSVLNLCVDAYVNDIISSLPKGWEKEVVELSNKEAVNGLPGVKYIDGINRNSSMGFPWNETKKRHLVEDKDEIYPDGVTFSDEIWNEVARIESLYKEGKRAYPVYQGAIKDEATSLAKIAIDKLRLFSAGPIPHGLVVRKKLLPFVRLVQKNKFAFEAGPGTVTQSMEWTSIYNYLTQFGTETMVAGDYKRYDKKMMADFILAAFRVIYKVYLAAGYAPHEIVDILAMGEDTAFPVTNINGDLVEFFGTNPSGHTLTVIINCIVGSLYIRYCYHELNPEREVSTFRNNVALFTYGDDNIMGVNPKTPWFNHVSITQQLSKFGVDYTMADKTSQSVPYINISECSFLKRSWVWDRKLSAWMAPLEEESIIKSLSVWVPSGTICREHQMVNVISSANSEYFFHGEEKFNYYRSWFEEILNRPEYKSYVTESTLPTYDQLVERFKNASLALGFALGNLE